MGEPAHTSQCKQLVTNENRGIVLASVQGILPPTAEEGVHRAAFMHGLYC